VTTPGAQRRLAAVVDSLFRRWPSLVGFAVQEVRAGELVLADIATSPWPVHSQDVCGEIATVLLRLIDDEPAARELLLGRTFARALH
jgi:hypothetical protein